jgi:hypothetical protein
MCIFRCVHNVAKSGSFVVSGRRSVCMEQLGFHWMAFHVIWCFQYLFQKFVKTSKVSLTSDNKGYIN